MFNSYRNRVHADGSTIKESIQNSTKRQAVNYILDSPSNSKVFINMLETIPVPCIASSIRTFYEVKFLFLPNMKVNVGDYVTYEDRTYLATDAVLNDTYPQLIGELCNVDFPIRTEESKVKVGVDALGRPLYKTQSISVTRPCVMTEKIYSQANNNPIPLPDGNVIVKIPYSDNELCVPDINANVTLHNMDYKVSTISYEKVYKGKGVLEIQLQRTPNT